LHVRNKFDGEVREPRFLFHAHTQAARAHAEAARFLGAFPLVPRDMVMTRVGTGWVVAVKGHVDIELVSAKGSRMPLVTGCRPGDIVAMALVPEVGLVAVSFEEVVVIRCPAIQEAADVMRMDRLSVVRVWWMAAVYRAGVARARVVAAHADMTSTLAGW
jgi:hypothetical protein